MTECPSDKVVCSFQEAVFSTICANNTRDVTRHGGLFGNDTGCHSLFYLLFCLLFTSCDRALLFVLAWLAALLWVGFVGI